MAHRSNEIARDAALPTCVRLTPLLALGPVLQFAVYIFIPIGMFYWFNVPEFQEEYTKDMRVCGCPLSPCPSQAWSSSLLLRI